MLVKRCLVGSGGEPFVFSGFLENKTAFFKFWPCSLQSSSYLYYLASFSSKTVFSDAPKQSWKCWRWLKSHSGALPPSPSSLQLLQETFCNPSPYFLWKQPRPPLIIWVLAGGLRMCTTWSYCAPCTIFALLVLLCSATSYMLCLSMEKIPIFPVDKPGSMILAAIG